ncbi:MAG: hypothetical protein AAGF31_11695 [Planctomycetota bacterium]
MAATNRAAKITKLITTLKKHYKPVPPPKERSLLDTLLFACLLENSLHEDAEQAFTTLRDGYFDWNEVRVTTKKELAESCKGLNDSHEAAARLKAVLQSIFETFYAFDIEAMKKQNLGQSIKQLEKLPGSTRFVVAYAVQNSLGGHSIAVNDGLLTALKTLDIISDAEAKAGTVPGLERAVPKTKGAEVGSVLHQLGVEVGKSPYGQAARKRLLAIDPKCKDRLPKRPPKPEPKPEKKPAATEAKKPESTKAEPKKADAKKPAKPAADKKAAAKKPAAAKSPGASKAAGKKVVKKVAKKTPAKKPAKSTPKKAVKKSASKKVAGKKKAVKKRKKKAPAKRKPR